MNHRYIQWRTRAS